MNKDEPTAYNMRKLRNRCSDLERRIAKLENLTMSDAELEGFEADGGC